MTREDAINRVQGYLTDYLPVEDVDELEEIIKALEQEPCEDTISRQAAIDALDKRFDSIPMEQTTEILQLRKDLRELPSAQSEIIRCKDCKHRTSYWGNCKLLEEKYHQTVRVSCDEFCSFAERRKGEGNL